MSEDTKFMLVLLGITVVALGLVGLGFLALWLEDTRERRMLARRRRALRALGRATRR